jgi:hypothetical protein
MRCDCLRRVGYDVRGPVHSAGVHECELRTAVDEPRQQRHTTVVNQGRQYTAAAGEIHCTV